MWECREGYDENMMGINGSWVFRGCLCDALYRGWTVCGSGEPTSDRLPHAADGPDGSEPSASLSPTRKAVLPCPTFALWTRLPVMSVVVVRLSLERP